ncbi:proteasome (prosome, macropain) assembly chaperone 3 [Plakobranchus ocellatus]|uniref:Proteasome (Prosome, macropain) assembly chaperone 3 n=1 Tax=Plakobranchus ocellatus TaxID=259542 RepID=A0AAV4CZ57_9GAST|nr:proteasome (prosome, macropain) assembly chaperone 3 [Plakobranchus ocellatus]
MAASMNSSVRAVPSKQAAADIAGHHTEIVVMKFQDQLFIIASQFMKIGTVVQVTRDVISDEVQGHVPMFSTKVLLGKDEPMTHVMAKTIVTELNPPTSVLLTLALKVTTPDVVQQVTDLIKTCL